MDGSGGIGGLATIIASSGITPTKTVTQSQNNNVLLLQAEQLGDVFRGVVKSRGVNNSVTIKTDQGATITIQTDVFLKRGAEVALKIEQRAGEALLRIISVDGQSLGKYVASLDGETPQQPQDKISPTSPFLRQETSSSVQSSNQPMANTTAFATQTTTLRGIFLNAPQLEPSQLQSLPPTLQAALSQASTGTSLQIAVTNILAPNPNNGGYIPLSGNIMNNNATINNSGMQHNIATSSDYATLGHQATPTPQTATKVQPNNPIPVQTQVTHTVQTTSNDGVASTAQTNHSSSSNVVSNTSSSPTVTSPVPSPNSPYSFTATVLQSTHPRELTLHTNFGSLKVFVSSPLPENSIIQFEIQNIGQVRGGNHHVISSSTTSTQLQHFEAMEKLDGLYHTISVTGESVPVANILPKPGPTLTAELLFLLSALKGGDIRRWVGQSNTDALDESLGKEFMNRLASELTLLKTIPTEPRDGQWHQVMLPMFAEEKIQPLQLYFKKKRQQNEQGEVTDTDHFMVDIELTRLGRIQLDGLVQKHIRNTQFDLIIRTEKPWEPFLQDAIKDIYIRAKEVASFHGTLNFRHGRDSLLIIPVDNKGQQATNTQSIIV